MTHAWTDGRTDGHTDGHNVINNIDNIDSQFEHDLSQTRANGSPSKEPDLALADDPTVQRNGPVWSGHDSGSRACSGGVGSCSY